MARLSAQKETIVLCFNLKTTTCLRDCADYIAHAGLKLKAADIADPNYIYFLFASLNKSSKIALFNKSGLRVQLKHACNLILTKCYISAQQLHAL